MTNHNQHLSHLEWPFFDDSHRELAHELNRWCATQHISTLESADVDEACRRLVRQLGEGGWLRYSVPSGEGGVLGGLYRQLDSRSICLIRETLARHHALADFSFAMQGLGSGAISLAGDEHLKQHYLPLVASGE